MSIVTDIAKTWRAPRQGLRRRLAGADEVMAIVTVMLGCLMIFVSQWPVHARAAYLDPEVPLGGRLAGAGVALFMVLPVLLYGLAALSRLIVGFLGAKGSYFGARMALFWALLAASPLWLLNGMSVGFVGPSPASTITGLAALGVFGIFWLAGLIETQFPGKGTAHV